MGRDVFFLFAKREKKEESRLAKSEPLTLSFFMLAVCKGRDYFFSMQTFSGKNYHPTCFSAFTVVLKDFFLFNMSHRPCFSVAICTCLRQASALHLSFRAKR